MKRIAIPDTKQTLYFALDRVLLLKGDRDCTHIYVLNAAGKKVWKKFCTSHHLKYYETKLKRYGFQRTNKSTMVQLDKVCILKSDRTVTLSCPYPEIITLTDTYYREFKNRIAL